MSDGGTFLFVVERGRVDVFSALYESFKTDPDVRVLWDRRVRERRTGPCPVVEDRRRIDRRHLTPASWNIQGFVLVPVRGTVAPS
jgi:hypothetical protein